MHKVSYGRGRYFKRNQKRVCIYDLQRLSFPDKDLTLSELVQEYSPDNIPLFMKVTVGYCGANAVDFTFSTEEVSAYI